MTKKEIVKQGDVLQNKATRTIVLVTKYSKSSTTFSAVVLDDYGVGNKTYLPRGHYYDKWDKCDFEPYRYDYEIN